MSITVKDCLKLPSLRSGKIIAGEKGSSRIVNTVSVLEVADNRMFALDNPVDNGDMCITSLFTIKDDIDMQCKIIEHLSDMGDACIVLYYVGVYLQEVSQELIDVANKLNFPIILMPENRMDFRYTEAISEVSDIIRRDKNNSSNFVDKITTLVSHLPDNKKTLSNLMRIISDNLKCSLLFCDSNMAHTSVSVWPISNDLSANTIINTYESLAKKDEMMVSTIWNEVPTHIFRVPFSSVEYNNYSLYGVDTLGFLKLDDLYQVTELLLIFSKLWDIDSEDILSGSLVPTIMEGDEENMRLISKRISLDIKKINSMIIIDTQAENSTDYALQYKTRRKIIQNVKSLSEESKRSLIVDTYGIYILCFTNISSSNDFDMNFIENLQDIIADITPNYFISIFPNENTINNVRKTYEFYLNTIDDAKKIFPLKKVLSYGDIIFADKCRTAITSDGDTFRICENIFSALNDSNDNDNLFETISSYYLDCDCKINKTSELLFLHRNTIQYRLNRVKEITNFNPKTTFDVSLLQMAVGCFRLTDQNKE